LGFIVILDIGETCIQRQLMEPQLWYLKSFMLCPKLWLPFLF